MVALVLKDIRMFGKMRKLRAEAAAGQTNQSEVVETPVDGSE